MRGLTTAAVLWTTACLGILIGSGYMAGSVCGFLAITFILSVMTRWSHYMDEHKHMLLLYMEVDKTNGMKQLYNFLENKGYLLETVEKQRDSLCRPKTLCCL